MTSTQFRGEAESRRRHPDVGHASEYGVAAAFTKYRALRRTICAVGGRRSWSM
jgi:hypothetical protein